MNLRRTHLPALFLLAAVGLTGCGASESGSTEGAEPAADAPRAMSEDEAGGDMAYDADGTGARSASSVVDRPSSSTSPLQQPAIIQIGTMTVQSDDVAAARFDLDKVVDAVQRLHRRREDHGHLRGQGAALEGGAPDPERRLRRTR